MVRMREISCRPTRTVHNPEDSKISIANPQKFLPLAKFALESDALGNPEGRDADLGRDADFPAVSHARRYPPQDW